MGLLSAIFGNGKPEENQQEKQTQKNFEILKYDGIRAHNMNQLAYAAKCLEQASALRDDAETLQYLADTYVKLQRTDDARTTLDKLTGLEPDNIQGYLFLANVCFAQGDYDGMDKACQKAIKLDESNAHAYYLAARAAHGLHNDLQAIVMATKAITQDESFLSAYLLRAEVLWSMKQAKETLEDLDYILNANPEEEDALLLKSTVKATLGETDEAYRCLDLVMETNPFNEKAYLLKGELLCGQKAYGKAIELYTEALELMPQNATFYQERGRVRLLEGDKNGSIEDLKKAIELNPESESQINGTFDNQDTLSGTPNPASIY